MNKRLHTAKYIFFDILASILSWVLFYFYRKIYIESSFFGYDIPVEFGTQFYLSLILIPVFWVFIHFSVGYYRNVYRKSRLKELGQTLITTLVGVLVLFFILILDDTVQTYKNYYNSFFTLFSLQFLLTYIPRLIITTITTHKIHSRKIGFNTVIIGSNGKSTKIYKDIEAQKKSAGKKFVGFINVYDRKTHQIEEYLPHLGNIEHLKKIIMHYKVEEVIIAIEKSEHDEIDKIINKLQQYKLSIQIIPEMHDILTGAVRMSSIYGAPLISVSCAISSIWQQNLKRFIDIFASVFAIVILSPLYLFLMIGVKLSSKGPIFYKHERIGIFGRPFMIYKFRSMYIDAEKNGPALSSDNDSRITKFGLFMRKSRLDELPQFWNTIKGDMSLVGPRPERQFFIDQIIKTAPHYLHLHKVKPGITSWGQVKYGYAENVEEMIERLNYDMLYLENMSLYVDFKILIYTVITVLKRSGK